MVNPLHLNDLLSIRDLQTRGVQLDLERALLWPHSPLVAALAAPFPFVTIGAETFLLYPAPNSNRAIGLMQARRRPGRPEADICFIAPALDADQAAVTVWYRLIADLAATLSERGAMRFYAGVPTGNGTEEVFRQTGFTTYAVEEVYRLAAPPNVPASDTLRPQRHRDAWNLLRVYTQSTPRPVQQAEGMYASEGTVGKISAWWDQARGVGYVMEKEQNLAGAVRLMRGSAGYWLRFWLHPQAQEYAESLVRAGLSLLREAPARPVYVSVRDYQSGLRPVLPDLGFEMFATRSLMVKHTTVRAREPVLRLVPALDKSPQPATPVSHPTNFCAENRPQTTENRKSVV